MNNTNNNDTKNNTKPITLYYRNIMNNKYKIDEKIMNNIITKNIKSTDTNQKIKLLIYYKNAKTANLITKNNNLTNDNPLQKSYVIYQYQCQIEGCDLQTYIGITITTLSRRLTCHLSNGGPSMHTEAVHNRKIKRQDLLDGTKIIDKSDEYRKLQIMEALYIKELEPTINKQIKSNFSLPSQMINSTPINNNN